LDEVDEENPNKKTRVYCTEPPKKVVIKQVVKKEEPKKVNITEPKGNLKERIE
jgi:hypothetical protein